MVRTPPRSTTLARHLLAAIVRDELRPGDPIDPVALGRRHGVSRTVVREALADLGGKGLVLARPRIGTTVAPPDSWHLLDPELMAEVAVGAGADGLRAEAAALRRVIEPALAADAAQQADRPQRAAVLGAVRALADAVGRADGAAFADADAALHTAIAGACRNRLLQAIDRAIEPVRAVQRARLAADPGGARTLRALVLQTGLALAVARRERVAAASWALELAGWTTTTDLAGPTLPAPGVRAVVPTAALRDAAAEWPETAAFAPPVPTAWRDASAMARPGVH